MMVNTPLTRPYFLGGWHWAGTLRFPWKVHVMQWELGLFASLKATRGYKRDKEMCQDLRPFFSGIGWWPREKNCMFILGIIPVWTMWVNKRKMEPLPWVEQSGPIVRLLMRPDHALGYPSCLKVKSTCKLREKLLQLGRDFNQVSWENSIPGVHVFKLENISFI